MANQHGVQPGFQTQGLQLTHHHFSATRIAQDSIGQNHPENGDRLGRFVGIQLGAIAHGRASSGVQQVQRNRFHLQIPQRQGQIHPVCPGFAHAQNAPGAGLDARRLQGFDGGNAVLPAMGGGHVREKGLRRFQVVVVARHARFLEGLGLIRIHFAQGAAGLDVGFSNNLPHRFQNLFKFAFLATAILGAAPLAHQTKALGSGGFGGLGLGQNFLGSPQTIDRGLLTGVMS